MNTLAANRPFLSTATLTAEADQQTSCFHHTWPELFPGTTNPRIMWGEAGIRFRIMA
jgi:hypothetical protein